MHNDAVSQILQGMVAIFVAGILILVMMMIGIKVHETIQRRYKTSIKNKHILINIFGFYCLLCVLFVTMTLFACTLPWSKCSLKLRPIENEKEVNNG